LVHHGVAAGLFALGACGEAHLAGAGDDAGRSALPADTDTGAGAAANDDAVVTIDAGDVSFAQHDAAAAPDASAISARLQDEGVRVGAIARRVLYSWTSAKQVAELRANPLLLTRSESTTRGVTQLSSVLATLAANKNPLAERLVSAEFAKGRYAWSHAWAVRRGWQGESYGDQLLRIVLKPEALVVLLRGKTLSVVDLEDREVDVASALAQPERIAVVYFVNEGAAARNGACGSFSDCATGAFREYFINNERMVQEWSLGTQPIREELERSISVVTALRDWFLLYSYAQHGACNFETSAVCTWQGAWGQPVRGPGDPLTLLDRYQEALALTSEYYAPTAANMDALLADLRTSLVLPEPLSHNP
jgi:hypothetical protein